MAKSAGQRGKQGGASWWLRLHGPCTNTSTQPQREPVAVLNATSDYFVFVFLQAASVRDATKVENTEVEMPFTQERVQFGP